MSLYSLSHRNHWVHSGRIINDIKMYDSRSFLKQRTLVKKQQYVEQKNKRLSVGYLMEITRHFNKTIYP